MRKMILMGVLLVSSMGLVACGDTPPAGDDGADLVFVGGSIWTADDNQPSVEAVAVKDGLITFVGREDGARQLVGSNTEVINLGEGALYPGFTDAHAHLRGIGERELTLNLDDIGSIEALKYRLSEVAIDAQPGAVIIGRGWIETHWTEGRFPNRYDLDAVASANPVILERADGHALVANSMAMDLANIKALTEAPAGGEIEKDFKGNPTGVLIDAAMSLIGDLVAAPSSTERQRAYKVAGAVYNKRGWTGVHSMSVDPEDVPLIEGLAASGGLSLRVYNALDGDNPAALQMLASGPRDAADGLVTTRALKLYMDGSLGSRGAMLLAPYSDSDTSGLAQSEKSAVMPILEASLRNGTQVVMHAIGDRGNRQLLDWYDEAFAAVPPEARAVANPRWRDEHAQILHADDIPRFAALGVIPSMQPSHAIGDLYFAPNRLGPDRLKGAYAWRSLMDSGAVIAGGSDAPVEQGDPIIEYYATVVRKGLDGFSNDDWHREERATRVEALKMFTLWAAYASFREDKLGTIEVGKIADLSVFSADIVSIIDSEILRAEAVMTIVEGKVVYRSDRD